jgi:hypothetical protein
LPSLFGASGVRKNASRGRTFMPRLTFEAVSVQGCGRQNRRGKKGRSLTTQTSAVSNLLGGLGTDEAE